MQVKYASYEALRMLLARAKIKKAGRVASLLLDTFVEQNGYLTASRVVAAGICAEGEFTLWRANLVKKGWLDWRPSEDGGGRVRPGNKLISYINREKISTKELATRQELDQKADRDEVRELCAKVSELEEMFNKVVEAHLKDNPPDTPARRKKLKENMRKTGRLCI